MFIFRPRYVRHFLDLTDSLDIGSSIKTLDTEADFILTNKNTPILIDVVANDEDGVVLTNVVTSQNGSAIIRDNSIFYTPTTDFVGPDSIKYTVTKDDVKETQIAYIYVIEPKNKCKVYTSLIYFNTENQPIAVVENGNIETIIKNNAQESIRLKVENGSKTISLDQNDIYTLTCNDIPYVDGTVPPPLVVNVTSLSYGVTISDDELADVTNNTGGDLYVIT